MSISDLICDLGLDTRGEDTRGWRMLLIASAPKRILQVHLEKKFLELVQREKPTGVYVTPSTDPDVFDVWQTPPNDGVRLWVGRTRADNPRPGVALRPFAPSGMMK